MAKEPLSKIWNDAKKEFEALTGKSKPKESKGLMNAFGSYTGLSGSLEKFDKADKAGEETNTLKPADLAIGNKLTDAMEVQLAAFKKASASYSGVLKKTIDQEIDKRTEGDAKTTYERALKFLNKQLDAISETGESRVAAMRQRFNTAEKDLSVKAKMLINWEKNMKGALARAAASAAKVKASPTVATYNSVFPTAARDVTMQLVFAKELGGFLMDPADLLKSMGPWGRQDGSAPATLAQDAGKDEVIRQLAGFIKELKLVQQLVGTKNVYRT